MITEQTLIELEGADEYSLRHYGSEVSELVEAHREMRKLLHDIHPILLQRNQSALSYRERMARRIERLVGRPSPIASGTRP